MKTKLMAIIAVMVAWVSVADAQYVLVLKNGHQIFVQSYREEASMVKFYGFGGEIGISKDQIIAVRKVGEADARGRSVLGTERAQPVSTQPTAPESPSVPPSAAEKQLSPEEERAKEEKEYQQKLIDVTLKLREVQDGYSQSVRGTTSGDPNLQWSEEQRGATRDDVISRFREATSNPSEPTPVRLLTPSPFSSLPPTTVEDRPAGRTPTSYDAQQLPTTERQRELSDFRKQAIQLELERERLINEIKQKNFDSVKILP
jgi:hypothetical protein